MDANTQPDAMSSSELAPAEYHPCPNCQERSYLRILVAELLFKNQLLRFELSQSQVLVGQL